MEHENRPFNLIDGATGETLQVIREVDEKKKISENPELSLEECLEAYEDIFDSEVGDTSLVRARNIEREVGLRQIYLKFEGGNPTGTQKDRIAFAQAMDALQRGFDTITVATCGNYGVAFALAAGFAGLRCRIYIPQEYHTNRIKEMTHLGAEIVQAYLIKSENCEDLNPGKIRQTSVNEPLINWRSIDGNLALEAIRQTGGWAANASDKAMYKYTSLIRQKEGLQVLPASTAGLIALMTHHKKEPLSSDRFVVVLTGRKS